MSDSVQPHRRQPTRFRHPWDSPGKNTGVGCHFLLQCVKVKSLSHVQLVATPWTAAYQAPPSMRFSSKSTGVACHCLLQQCRGDRVDEKKYWISSGKIVETDQNILVLAYMKLINKSRYIMMHVFGVTYVKA